MKATKPRRSKPPKPAPEPSRSDGDPRPLPRRSEPTERMCIVTRDVRPVDELIRFVLDPEGTVVADLRHRLPGRGVWVSADAASVEAAEKKKLFARGFKEAVKVEPGLAGRVAERLTDAALGALSLARKAGELVLGFAKVEAAIASGEAVAVIHAAEAAEDGVRKLEAAIRRRPPEAPPVTVIRSFGADQMGLALARPNVIHAALLAGRASSNVISQVAALARFLEREPPDGVDFHISRPGTEPTAGHRNG